MSPLLSFVLCEPGGGGVELLDLGSAMGKEYEVSLSDGCDGSFSLQFGSEEQRAIVVGGHDIKVYRNNELIGRGRIISSDRNSGDDSVVSYKFVSYKQMLDTKKIFVTDDAAVTGYTAVDVEAAAWDLIDTAQTRASGGGATAFNIIRDGSPTGRSIAGYKLFEAGTSVRDALDDMSQTATTAGADDQWEWDIRAQENNLVFETWATRRGKAAIDANYYFDNSTNLISFNENTSLQNFANYLTVQGDVGANTLQTWTFGGPTSGHFKYVFRGQTTASFINYNTDVADIQTALEALSTIGTGNVEVTSRAATHTPSGGAVYIKFIGQLGYKNQPLLTISSNTLSPGSVNGTVTTAGYRYVKYLGADDYDTDPRGIVEYYHYDAKLTDTQSVDERAAYLLSTLAGLTPSLTFEIPQDYPGKNAFWIGDFVIVALDNKPARTDLRVSSIHFTDGEDGEESISVTVEVPAPIDRTETNIARRVAGAEKAAKARKAALLRAKTAQRGKLQEKLDALKKHYATTGNRKIDPGRERKSVEALQAKISQLKAEISKLR